MNDYDVLIAGTGVAGLYSALNFAPDVRVLVLSKRESTLCNSFLAQGGVAAVVDKEHDDYRLHIADTLIAGGYKNDLRSLEILVNEGPEDVLRLMKEIGVDFDTDEAHHISMTLEGGHSRRRILHHKDSTGREITEKLMAAVQTHDNVTIMDWTQLVTLTPQEGGFWAGLLQNGEYKTVSCSYCILCTGGIGRVYPYTTNSAIATGDGITLAYELGARIKNLRLVQFHPTAFAAETGRERFLISEAVRGEGALLLNCDGERFMPRYDERGELAPRDVVSRCIMQEAARTGSEKSYLDITVTDIVQEAKVARVSFYRNFASISEVLDSIADATAEKLNIEFLPMLDTTDERKLRKYLFNYFYQISLNYKEMWAIRGLNMDLFTKRLGEKIHEKRKAVESAELNMAEKYGWVVKLCVLDGVSRRWIMDEMKETPEEIIDYVMPIIKTL